MWRKEFCFSKKRPNWHGYMPGTGSGVKATLPYMRIKNETRTPYFCANTEIRRSCRQALEECQKEGGKMKNISIKILETRNCWLSARRRDGIPSCSAGRDSNRKRSSPSGRSPWDGYRIPHAYEKALNRLGNL